MAIKKVKILKFDTNVEEVTVTAWIRHEGDTVRKGDPLVEVTTDKANIEMESPASGILRKILAPEKSVVPVGYIIALVGDQEGDLPDVASLNAKLIKARRPALSAKAPAGEPAPGSIPGAIRATPAARRLARESGFSLADIQKAFNVEVVKESTVQDYRERLKKAGTQG